MHIILVLGLNPCPLEYNAVCWQSSLAMHRLIELIRRSNARSAPLLDRQQHACLPAVALVSTVAFFIFIKS
jgi:hypothetical protein